MAGPSKNVQGGYLGYSALSESYWNALNQVRTGETKRLEQEKLELENEATINEQFQIPGYERAQQPGGSRSGARGGKAPTVVTNNGFSYTANINDPKLMEFLQPPDANVDPTDPAAYAELNYRKNVSQQQKELFKGKDFTLDGSTAQAGGGFNSALQGALEGLKSEYVKAGRRTSPRKRRESRGQIQGQLQALQAFGQEIQGLQGSYGDAYNNGMISYGTKSEFIDFLNTVNGPNNLEVVWEDGRGFLRGESAGGKYTNMPLDNLESLKNGLVLKQNNPAGIVNSLVQSTNAIRETVDERGVKIQNNNWTEETTNQVQSQLAQLLPDNNATLSMGIDWLGFNGTAWKKKVASDPEGSKQIVLDALAAHVKSQHNPQVKGGLTEDQYADNTLQADKFSETQRHNRISESQAQQRIDKPSGSGGGTGKTQDPSVGEHALRLSKINNTLEKITPGKGKTAIQLSELVGGKVKSASYQPPGKDYPDFPDGYYKISVAGGGENRIDVNDKDFLFEYLAEAQGVPLSQIAQYKELRASGATQSNNTQSNDDAAARREAIKAKIAARRNK